MPDRSRVEAPRSGEIPSAAGRSRAKGRSGLGSTTAAGRSGPPPFAIPECRACRLTASIRGHDRPQVRLHHRRRRIRRMRARQPPVGRSRDARPRPRGRPARLPVRRVHPHAGGPDLPDRQPLLRLEVRVRARAVHERPAHLPRPRQGPRRLVEHQRPDLPARQPARLRALGGRPGDGDAGTTPTACRTSRRWRPASRPRRTIRGAATTGPSSSSADRRPTRCSRPSSPPARRPATT